MLLVLSDIHNPGSIYSKLYIAQDILFIADLVFFRDFWSNTAAEPR